MNNLYNFDLPLSMRLSGVTANTPEEYQNILNALYKGTYADPTYIQQQRDEVRQKYLATEAGQKYPDAPPALGGIGDPVYENEQAQSWKNYVQQELNKIGVFEPQTTSQPESTPTDLETVQNIDQDQAKEEASQDFLGDYIASSDWPSGPGGKPEPPVIPSTDPQRWPMIPGGPSRPGPSGTGTTYPLAGTKDDTLIAATYPSDPKWMREIDKLYKEVKNKPYRPGDPKPGRGMGDIWPRAQLEQEKKVDTAIAAARKGSDEKRQLETFQSEFDPQKARTAVQAATNYRVGSGNSDPFRNTAFA